MQNLHYGDRRIHFRMVDATQTYVPAAFKADRHFSFVAIVTLEGSRKVLGVLAERYDRIIEVVALGHSPVELGYEFESFAAAGEAVKTWHDRLQ